MRLWLPQEAQILVNSCLGSLDLVLHNRRGEDQKRKKSINNTTSTTNTVDSSLLATAGAVKWLPLPASPEYIALQSVRERKKSESLSSLCLDTSSTDEVSLNCQKYMFQLFYPRFLHPVNQCQYPVKTTSPPQTLLTPVDLRDNHLGSSLWDNQNWVSLKII